MQPAHVPASTMIEIYKTESAYAQLCKSEDVLVVNLQRVYCIWLLGQHCEAQGELSPSGHEDPK